jgi:hypothetical protein
MTARVQDAGLANITAALVAASAVKFLQWGTGSGAIKSANVVTTTTTTEARTSGTMSQVTGAVTNDTLQVTGTITAAGTRAITEVGVFDAAGTGSPPTGGNMDVYGDFAVVNLGNLDSIAFTVKVTFA